MADVRGGTSELPDFAVFRTVFYYCFLILIVPITTFFGSKLIVFDGILRLAATSSNVYAAIATIVTLHVFLGLYIYKAYNESPQQTKPAKQD